MTDDKDAPVAKFKVGDLVRTVTHPYVQDQFSGIHGETFTVKTVNAGWPTHDPKLGPFYYGGDKFGSGVWERNLELAPVATTSNTYYLNNTSDTFNLGYVNKDTLQPDPAVEAELDAIVEDDVTLPAYHYLVIEHLKAQVEVMGKLLSAVDAELKSANDNGQDAIASYKLGILHQVRREQMSYERLIADVENLYNDLSAGNL